MNMHHQKQSWYGIVGIILTCILVQYDAQEPTWWYQTGEPYGSWWVQLATACYMICGAAVWLIPFGCCMRAWMAWQDEQARQWWMCIAILVPLSAALCAALHIGPQGIVAGGIMGQYVLQGVQRFWDAALVPALLVACMTSLIGAVYGAPLVRWIAYLGRRAVHRFIVPAFEKMVEMVYAFAQEVWDRYMRPAPRVSVAQGGVSYHEPMVPAQKLEPSPKRAVCSDEQQEEVVVAPGSTYQLPAVETIFGPPQPKQDASSADAEQGARTLEKKLAQFGIRGSVTAVIVGPVVTLFEYQPEGNVAISKIRAREHDLALALEVTSLRIIAPIPGRPVVGFECSRVNRDTILFADHWPAVRAALQNGAQLPILLGVTTQGAPVVIDLAGMPHMLVAGSTGSGKSVALNSLIISLLLSKTPTDMRLILIDPKRLEFAWYADLAHLLFPIVTDPREAVGVLRWAVQEMEQRYTRLAEAGVKHAAAYRALGHEMPDIVIIVDEWADLMMSGGKDAEASLVRLVQMARAAGMHVVLATQRPSVNVITGLIKVNIPARVACKVTSKIDSRTILDAPGAEALLGKGDMLVMLPGKPLERMHGVYVTNQEIQAVACAVRRQGGTMYMQQDQQGASALDVSEDDRALYAQVVELIRDMDEISISLLQRRLRIGYNRSARMIDYLEAHGMLLPSDGGKMRKVLR